MTMRGWVGGGTYVELRLNCSWKPDRDVPRRRSMVKRKDGEHHQLSAHTLTFKHLASRS